MIQFIADNLSTIIVGAMVLGVVGLIVFRMIKGRGKHSACSCCSGCPSAGICHKETNSVVKKC